MSFVLNLHVTIMAHVQIQNIPLRVPITSQVFLSKSIANWYSRLDLDPFSPLDPPMRLIVMLPLLCTMVGQSQNQ